jgi:hypothetical protein
MTCGLSGAVGVPTDYCILHKKVYEVNSAGGVASDICSLPEEV